MSTLLDANQINDREKQILAGLFLSKYDTAGLKTLGFQTFTEAFNVLGYALGGKPALIKNYRDEFDPRFPNERKGWHKRPTRKYCVDVLKNYKDLDFETFASLLKALMGYDENTASTLLPEATGETSDSLFAKRLVTGVAAENYFASVHPEVSEFEGYALENTTRLGCGYDFRLTRTGRDFLAVEVKGLNERNGSLSLTPKEHQVACSLKSRFFLFVVKNFREVPFHTVYRDPISGTLKFDKKERVVVQISWATTV